MTLHTIPRPATRTQPQRLVFSPHRHPERQQATGEWLSTTAVCEVRR